MRISLLAILLTISLAAFVAADCPVGDLDDTCEVDFRDVWTLAMEWLADSNSVADLVGADGVDFADFAALAKNLGVIGQRTGSIEVVISPEAAVNSGAKWRLEDGPWRTTNEVVEVPIGPYTIEFSQIETWLEPPERNVTVVEGLITGVRAPYKHPIVINEFMASNSNYILDPQGEDDDWLELYNRGEQPIDVGGMYLESDRLWRIPDGNPDLTTIDPCGYLLIWADRDVNDSGLHASFQLGADGDNIDLFDTDGSTLLDSIDYPVQDTNISYGRYPDGNDNWRYFSSPTPDSANNGGYLGSVADIEFSHHRGFYDSSFLLTLACETEGVLIYYTLDGSEPYKLSGRLPTGMRYVGPISINKTKTRYLRARARKRGWKPTKIDTHTYIFLARVIQQPDDPEGFHATDPSYWWGHDGPDYEMDTAVINAYSSTIKDDLKSIPTMSLVMSVGDLFKSDSDILVGGIYANPDWEDIYSEPADRPVSVEFIDPCDLEEFQIDAAVRICGGSSTGGWKMDKLSMRLKFRAPYGPTKLNFPLFGDDAADSFDTLVLDARMNNSWGYGGKSGGVGVQNARAQYTRDQFTSDIQNAMGGYGHHGQHVHLYLNGLYWGLYCLHERPDEHFAETYFGGEAEDYDVLKHSRNNVVSGSNANYNEMFSIANGGLSSDVQYQLIQQYLDVPNFIDYMITNFYVGNTDWAHHNWYATRNVYDPAGRWRYHSWDPEHCLKSLTEDVTGKTNDYGDPTYLHQKLKANDEYRMLFADHVHRHFFNDGILTVANATALYQHRLDVVDRAVVGESARWGDNQMDETGVRYTRDVHWVNQRYWLLNTYFPDRTDEVLTQFRDEKSPPWYPQVAAPVFNPHGGWDLAGFDVTVTAPGTILYTTDGNDPRMPGGSPNPDAETYSSAIHIEATTNLKARTQSGSTWSALNEAIFAVGPVAQNLRITEIMYHPQDTNDPNDPNEEFIELTNIGPDTINLNLVRFTNGVDFTFPNVQLAEGEHILVVKDQNAFEAEYGTGYNIAGEYFGSLNNGGERVELQDAAGQTILNFRYEDGWQDITDGDGYSLTIIDADNPNPNSWDLKSFWRASAYSGGSPGFDDGIFGLPNPGAVVINEVLANSDVEVDDWLELHNTTPSDVNIGGWYLSDNDSNLMKYRIADGTIIGPNGYMVFTQDANFGKDEEITDPGRIIGFAFSGSGEEVCLSAADANGVLMGYREIEDFKASAPDVAFGLYTKSALAANAGDPTDFVSMSQNSKGLPNIYPPEVGPIVISEIAYHPNWPAWPVGGFYTNDSYEYIELRNTSLTEDVNLFRLDIDVNAVPWKFTDGIKYSFPTDATIDANDYVVIARDPNAFSQRYPSVPAGKIFGPFERNDEGRRTSLDNGGENLVLGMPAGLDKFGDPYYIRIDRVNYSDGTHPRRGFIDAWPEEADGGGKSLTRKALDEFGNDPNNWQASTPLPGE